jgi:hypothetical protein
MLSTASFKNRWLVDTGAYWHMTHDRALFQTYTKSNTLPEFETAGKMVRPIGIGTVVIHTENSSGQTVPLTLSNVYHLPTLPINLFSGTYIRERGAYVCGKTDTIRRIDDDYEIATIDVVARHLFLRQKDDIIMPVIHPKVTARTWHRRLGHVSPANVKKTASITEGMVLDKKDNSLDEICRPCKLGKAIRLVSREPQDHLTDPLVELHVDIIGPVTPTGFKGEKYGLMATCGYTQARFPYTYKEKAEAFKILTDLIIGIKTQYKIIVKVIRIDGGPKYGGLKWIDFYNERGIQLEPTTPYTLEQDGKAERGFRTVFERVRSIAIDQGLPKNLWPELYRGMIYIVNRTATSVLKDMTPIEALDRCLLGDRAKRPKIGHLRVLGSRATVHIPKERRKKSDKLGPRGVEGILVGFEGNHIYRVYIPGRRDIVRTSAIDFDESEQGESPKILDDASDLYEPNQAEDLSVELSDRALEHRGANTVDTVEDDEASIDRQLAKDMANH